MNDSRLPETGRHTLLELLAAIGVIGAAMYITLPAEVVPVVTGPSEEDQLLNVGFYRLEFDSAVDPRAVGLAVRERGDAELYDVLSEPDRTVLYVGLWVAVDHDPQRLVPLFESLPQSPSSIEPCGVPDLTLPALGG